MKIYMLCNLKSSFKRRKNLKFIVCFTLNQIIFHNLHVVYESHILTQKHPCLIQLKLLSLLPCLALVVNSMHTNLHEGILSWAIK